MHIGGWWPRYIVRTAVGEVFSNKFSLIMQVHYNVPSLKVLAHTGRPAKERS